MISCYWKLARNQRRRSFYAYAHYAYHLLNYDTFMSQTLSLCLHSCVVEILGGLGDWIPDC